MYLDGMSVNHLISLREAHRRNLEVLQLQEAKYGSLSCPPYIVIEIQDITEKIQNLDAQIKQAQDGDNDNTGRKAVKPDVLNDFVTQKLKYQVENKLRFTAYDITLALRHDNPSLEIIHDKVRHIVHLQMRLIVELGWYKREAVDYGDETARHYIPIPSAE
jgi:hypothetical protein